MLNGSLVITVRRILRLQMEEDGLQISRVAVNILKM